MTRSPVISFAFAAKAAALQARAGVSPLRDRIQLAALTLRSVPHDARACTAVADFIDLAGTHPIEAGVFFKRLIEAWTFERIPRDEPKQAVFDWQDRADLR